MPRIAYLEKKLSPKKLAVIAQANAILDEYRDKGFQLTLRQLYYQFVARALLENTPTSYDNLGATVADGRLCGLIDWYDIIDRTRNLKSVGHWDEPSDIIRAVSQQYRRDKWETQRWRVEVWIEKDALVGVIENVCVELDVPYFSCRGYTSLSEMWSAAQRLQRHFDAGQTPLIIHLGDHDPSGKDMTRDIFERLEMFMGGANVERIALNMDQVEQYHPPPNPAKLSDARAAAYVAEFGHESWELDALEPEVIEALIRDKVLSYRDEDLWAEAEEVENDHRRLLAQTSKRWPEVVDFLSK